MRDKIKLAKSWIFAQKLGMDSSGYKKHRWAVDELIDLADDKPEELRELVLEILKQDSSDEIVKMVGAGPLEDLMVNHGEKYIDRIEEQFLKSDVFKAAMKSVWLDGEDTSLSARFFKIAGTRQPFPD